MMSNISSLKEPYRAVTKGEWKDLLKFFDDDVGFRISYPMTVAEDNAFHIAVHSKTEEPLKQFLEQASDYMYDSVLNKTNAYENTVLHEAAINHNIKAVKLLVGEGYVTDEQLLKQNESGQTPLFKAAAFGSTKVVKYLASRPNQMITTGDNKQQLHKNHRINGDGFSILHAAVQGEHFGTALELLKLDEGLAELKTKNGMTSLHLLTNLRSAFTNKFSDQLWHSRLLYYCIPTGDDNYDDADNFFDSEEISNPTCDDQSDERLIIIEDGDGQNPSPKWKIFLETINKSFWNCFIKGNPICDDQNDDERLIIIEVDDTLTQWKIILETINKSFWNCFIKDSRWPTAREIWVEKRNVNFAFKLARKLIKNDYSWDIRRYTHDPTKDYRASPKDKHQVETPLLAATRDEEMHVEMVEKEIESETAEDKHQVETPLLAATRTAVIELVKEILNMHPQAVETPLLAATRTRVIEIVKEILNMHPQVVVDDEVETPLLAATRRGVIELVKEILKKHPQAVEHVSHKKQNILHVAASYRQREIFDLVIKMEIPKRRLILGIDEEGYTVLHHVADNTNYTGGSRAGPAYQLQEELEWFQRVQKIMPSYFTQHLNKSNQTAQELFKEKHKDQHKEAQQWIKETSQSCSGVAVLVATVVFAAAFTVPGGNNDENGLPILIYSPFFMFFTVMDVVSLSCSLTAVVMFLSIVTSPFNLDNFRVSLPRRLTLGFALLFMSVATTMLAFTSTIILIIRSDQHRQWTLTLICCAAFVPVSVLALTHFPLFVSFIKAWNYLIALPCSSLLRILKFLGKLVLQLGLRFLNILRNLVRQGDHPGLENEKKV